MAHDFDDNLAVIPHTEMFVFLTEGARDVGSSEAHAPTASAKQFQPLVSTEASRRCRENISLIPAIKLTRSDFGSDIL